MPRKNTPGPLVGLVVTDGVLGIVTADGPVADIPITAAGVDPVELVARLRILAPRAVFVIPADPAPADPTVFERAQGQVLDACALAGALIGGARA